MRATEIEKLLESLDPAVDNGDYNMYKLSDGMFLGKEISGLWSILLEYPEGAKLPFGRTTKGISLQYFRDAEFLVNGKPSSFCWAVVSCTDPSQNWIFSVLVEGIFVALDKGLMNKPRDMLNYVAEWQDLLAAPATLTVTESIGLWGELYFILSSENIEKTVEMWLGPDKKKFDFSGDGLDIDVKTAVRGHYHHFSEEQLQPSATGSDSYIYSLHVEEDLAGGQSVSDLISKIRSVLLELELFEKKLLSTGYRDEAAERIKLSVRNVKLVPIDQVPKVTGKDTGVYNVKFEADLAFCLGCVNINNIINKLFG